MKNNTLAITALAGLALLGVLPKTALAHAGQHPGDIMAILGHFFSQPDHVMFLVGGAVGAALLWRYVRRQGKRSKF